VSAASLDSATLGIEALRLDGTGGADPIDPREAASPEVPAWIHIDFSNPLAADWAWNRSGMDDAVIGPMLDIESRPRALQHGSGVLITLRGVNLNPGARPEDMISVRAWLEPGRVVTAARRNLRSVTEIRQAIGQGTGPTTPARLLLELIDRLNRYIGEATEQIEQNIDAAEDEVQRGAGAARNSAFNRLRRQTAQIRRYLLPQRDALDRLSRLTDSPFSAAEQNELREHLNRLTLSLEDLDLVRERALVAQEELLNVLAHEQNSRMLLLSIVAAVFLPLSFLTGLLGMNVAGLPGTEFRGSFSVIVLLMAVVAALILALFRRRKWL
jgi:zinc transporter